MLEQATDLTEAIKTPIQLVENLWSLRNFQKALNLGFGKFLMPDVAKIAEATQLLRAAKMADTNWVKVSTHLYLEITAHLSVSNDNAGYLGFADEQNYNSQGTHHLQKNQVVIYDAPRVDCITIQSSL